jgi:ABC-type sulfate transport system permease component
MKSNRRGGFVALLAGLCLLSACESQRPGGRCVGINEDRAPGVKYETSVRNIVVAVIFVETIFVPVIVALKELSCPVEQSQPVTAPAGPQKVDP